MGMRVFTPKRVWRLRMKGVQTPVPNAATAGDGVREKQRWGWGWGWDAIFILGKAYGTTTVLPYGSYTIYRTPIVLLVR